MFFSLVNESNKKSTSLIDSIFKLRKNVFSDKLKWDLPVHGDIEFDEYDKLNPIYVVWTDKTKTILYGSVRLLPTSGPTLLHDVFGATHGHNPELKDPRIWEGTRLCLDVEKIAQHFPQLTPDKAFSKMLLALCECALDAGIQRLVSNFEPCLRRVYLRAGVELNFHGSADLYGKRPVCCASFEVSERILDKMRLKTEHISAIFQPALSQLPTLQAL